MRTLSFALLIPLLAGCGYQSGQISSGQGQTLAVPLFGNETFRRNLEKDLTRAVHQEISARTGYHLVAEANADLLMEGRIVDIREALISEREKGIVRESSVIVKVEIRVTDRKTGKLVVERTVLEDRQPFVPVTGESLRTAEVAAFRNLAEKIVYTLSAGW
jgi:outer membrane lipopolysaccharide assembly protein LptE/RlpB